MGQQTRASRSSLNAGTPDSLSDNESSYKITPRKTSTPYKSSLTPGKKLKISSVSIDFIKFHRQLLLIYLRCVSQKVEVARQADRPQDRQAGHPADQAANHLVDMDQRNRWMAPVIINNIDSISSSCFHQNLFDKKCDFADNSGTPSLIPRRTGTTGNTPTTSRHNSVSGRKSGTPVNGSSSGPRTPTGLRSPASGIPSK